MAGSPRRHEWSAHASEDLAAKRPQNGWLGPTGIKPGTRHKVVGEYPYTLVYRVAGSKIRLIRVLHQRQAYFQRVK